MSSKKFTLAGKREIAARKESEKKKFSERMPVFIIAVSTVYLLAVAWSSLTEIAYYSSTTFQTTHSLVIALAASIFLTFILELSNYFSVNYTFKIPLLEYPDEDKNYYWAVWFIIFPIAVATVCYSWHISRNNAPEIVEFLAAEFKPHQDTTNLTLADTKQIDETIANLSNNKTLENGKWVTYHSSERTIRALSRVAEAKAANEQLIIKQHINQDSLSYAKHRTAIVHAQAQGQKIGGGCEILKVVCLFILVLARRIEIQELDDPNAKQKAQSNNQPQTDTTKELKHLLEDIRKNYNRHQANQKPDSPTPPKVKVEKDKEQGTGNKEQNARNREQGTGNREQEIRNKEQGTKGREHVANTVEQFVTLGSNVLQGNKILVPVDKRYLSQKLNQYKKLQKDSMERLQQLQAEKQSFRQSSKIQSLQKKLKDRGEKIDAMQALFDYVNIELNQQSKTA